MASLTRTAASLAGLLVLLISFTVYISTADLGSRRFSLPSLPLHSSFFCGPAPCAATAALGRRMPPLRVYMYDLPRRFNFAMMDHRPDTDPPPATGKDIPPWPPSAGIKKQHSVEYWMTVSLLVGEEVASVEEREAVRVRDGEVADVFFVPFFSSLSFNSHGRNMTDPDTEIDRKLQVDLLDILRKSDYWQRSAGRDHVFPMQHPNAFRFLRDQLNASILVVADFGRYPKSLSNLNKDVVAPYVHVVQSFMDDDSSDPFESRPTLLFFRGRTVRKDEGVVRQRLAKVLAGFDDVHFEDSFATGEGIKASTLGMRSSKFCLHPAGDTPSSCRLFDAIVSHCVPVIISDHIELPFETELDYTEFSFFFSVNEALQPGYLVAQLRAVSKDRWLELWKKLKAVSHHYEFHYPPKRDDAVNMLWRQVRQKLPTAKLAEHRSRRLKIPDWWN
ncbi:hypothetical protein KFK09_011126 [Dendrobium nobile]|uniref:Exostosin GT47 domain-containing protein n=1 Tax=Dendrobium nobile TaxID=94219 RepID=A0A8T3BBU0_DENNO|nr:hypothetical protein KFK09_011126 [Dendrobium nobile]